LDAGADCYIGQAEAFVEHITSYVGHAVGDCETCWTAAAGPKRTKGTVPNNFDRIAIRPVGDNHRNAGTGVARDGDGAVVGRERELRLHRGGQEQEQGNPQRPNGTDKSAVGAHGAASDSDASHIETSLCRFARPVKLILSPIRTPMELPGNQSGLSRHLNLLCEEYLLLKSV
jgi:hypothetical protein